MNSFFKSINTWIRSIKLFRHSEILRYLEKRQSEMLLIKELCKKFPSAIISDNIILTGDGQSDLILGDRVSINTGVILALGDDGNGYGNIAIGNDTWIGQYNNIRACKGGNIVIGSNCLISQFCTLVGSNHGINRDMLIREQAPDKSRMGVIIEDDVWLGAGVVVLPGVKVAKGAVVGANSVITNDVCEYEIRAGCPAEKIGSR